MEQRDPGTDASGHRARLRARLFADADTLGDHEIVEYLLALAIPRRDTKPLARRLLAAFGGYGRLMTADPEALMRVGGLSESAVAAIRIAEISALRLLRARISEAPILGSWQALLDYLHADMAHRPIERVRALHLDGKNRLIRDELVSEGTIDHAAVHVREIVRRAIDLGSTALILVHNHPSGDPAPSKADIQLTREVIDAGRSLGIAVHDHVIVGMNGHASLRALGVI